MPPFGSHQAPPVQSILETFQVVPSSLGRGRESRSARVFHNEEAWFFYRAISGVRLSWELEEPKGLKGFPRTAVL